LHLFLTNRRLDDAAEVHVSLADRAVTGIVDAEILTGPDPKAANSYEQPDVVRAEPFGDASAAGGRLRCTLPRLSFAAATVTIDR
jgi:alpha-L-arabinofuranosidase